MSFWSKSSEELKEHFQTDFTSGLTSLESAHRIKHYGKNVLKKAKEIGLWTILLRQLKSLIVLLLFLAAMISLFMQEYVEGISILFVLLINTIIGFITEFKAVRSMEALQRLGVTSTKTFRDGVLINLNAEELVPGDFVQFEAGDIVTADIRIIRGHDVQVDESSFSGESLPIEKKEARLPEKTALMDRKNMLFKGTTIVGGSVSGLVVATGAHTELGKIAASIQEAKEEITPLEQRLEILGKKLIKLTILIAIVIALSGILAGKDIFLMLEISIALAIAAIPEGLPVVATIALAKGMFRMAKRNVLINKLSAVETLGSVTTIFTDKTGTLTENKMVVEKLFLPEYEIQLDKLSTKIESDFQKAIEVFVLCNNASIGEKSTENFPFEVGDPLEVALLKAGDLLGFSKSQLEKKFPRVSEIPFNSERKVMGTIHHNGDYFYAVKGAPEVVLSYCDEIVIKGRSRLLEKEDREYWKNFNEQLAGKGYRVLSIAYKNSESQNDPIDKKLTFLGLICFRDPPRKEIETSLHLCHQAGIRPIMVTGDQAGTAVSIARDIKFTGASKEEIIVLNGEILGEVTESDETTKKKLFQTHIFSRVTPKQKFDLVKLYQDQGEIVAMTGDGVNDAPALKKADIGVAMGLRGTQVAKEASDVILQDDSFSSILSAIKQGRVIFRNIQLFVIYLLSCNISEIFIVSLMSILNLPVSLLPLQILFLNLITDVFPALALGMGEGDDSYMTRAPRDPSEPIINNHAWWMIVFYGLIITASTLLALILSLFYLKLSSGEALTICFLTLGLAQVFHVFNMRSSRSSMFINPITKNPHVWGATVFCFSILILSVKVEPLAKVLKLDSSALNYWPLITLCSLLPLATIQIMKLISSLREKKKL